MRKIAAALITVLLIPGWLLGETITISGSVTGPQEAPVNGATVKLYRVTMEVDSGTATRLNAERVAQTDSNADGTFTFTFDVPQGNAMTYHTCVAAADGLSYGWKTVMGQDQAMIIKLTEPQKLIGFIAEPDGTGIADADVSLILAIVKGGDDSDIIYGLGAIEELQAKTCSDGRFEFGRLPEGATAEVLVKKQGKAPLTTINNSIDPASGLTYTVGQPDILLTMQKPCTVSGMVLTQADQVPVEGISVIASQNDIPMTLFNIDPAVSAADGTFTISGIAPGKYTLRVVDCPDWIAEPVPLEVNGSVGARINLQTGGTLEVKVIDGASDQPVEKAHVQVSSQNDNRHAEVFAADKTGIARKRLLPGNYEVRAFASGYRSSSNAAVAVVEKDQTSIVEIRLGGQNKMTGLVKTPNGKPAEGVKVRILPSHVNQAVHSDKDGRFTLAWDPDRAGWVDGQFILLASDEKNELCRSLDIDSETKEVEIALEKGCIVKGKVLNEKGEPLKDARASLTIWSSNYGHGLNDHVETDDTGEYVFPSLPRDQKFSISISGVKGYGSGSTSQFDTQSDPSEPVTLENIVLHVADQTLSGYAVDIEGNGLENVDLYLYGDGQPNTNTKSGKDGAFKFENVCAGQAYVQANCNRGSDHIYGNLRTEGGASDIRVVLTGQGSYSRVQPKEPAPLAGKPLPSLANYGLTLTEGKPVLVFIWDMHQRPSRYFVKELAAKKELFENKDVTVVLLNAAKTEKLPLDAWLADNNIAFPSGIISIDPDNAAFGLGVRSMPWMILTDAAHSVKAEGFSMDQLADKLNAI